MTFKRPGRFEFDASLHSTSVGERDGIHNLIPGFPEIKDVEFVPHLNLYRALFPDYDIQIPQKDVQKYICLLTKHFPAEEDYIIEIHFRFFFNIAIHSEAVKIFIPANSFNSNRCLSPETI